jgi:hypothetical protein
MTLIGGILASRITHGIFIGIHDLLPSWDGFFNGLASVLILSSLALHGRVLLIAQQIRSKSDR